MIKLFKNCIGFVFVTGISIFLAQHLKVESDIFFRFNIFGSFAFFFADYLTGSGFRSHGQYVSTGTPGCVWKFLAIILWIISIIILCHQV